MVGGFSARAARGGRRRLYLIETAERGIQWMRLTATRPGWAQLDEPDQNAVTAVCGAVAR